MTQQNQRRLSAALPALALALAAVLLSACGESQPGATSLSEAQAAPTTLSAPAPTTSVPSTAAPTTTAPAPAVVRDETWDMEFTVDLAQPGAYSFGGFGDLLFHIDGDRVRVTGDATIGDGTYEELEFAGVLDGDRFTLLTTEFTVEAVYGDDAGTEDVTLELPPFALTGDTVQATGSIVIVTRPWAPTRSGTFTIILTRSVEN